MNLKLIITFLVISSCGLVTVTVDGNLRLQTRLVNISTGSVFQDTINPLEMIKNQMMGLKAAYYPFGTGINIPEQELEKFESSFKLYCKSMDLLWNIMMSNSNEDELKPFKQRLNEAKSILEDTCVVVENGKIRCIINHGKELDFCYNDMPAQPTDADVSGEKIHKIGECNKKALLECSSATLVALNSVLITLLYSLVLRYF